MAHIRWQEVIGCDLAMSGVENRDQGFERRIAFGMDPFGNSPCGITDLGGKILL
jgi:hypothetical protein